MTNIDIKLTNRGKAYNSLDSDGKSWNDKQGLLCKYYAKKETTVIRLINVSVKNNVEKYSKSKWWTIITLVRIRWRVNKRVGCRMIICYVVVDYMWLIWLRMIRWTNSIMNRLILLSWIIWSLWHWWCDMRIFIAYCRRSNFYQTMIYTSRITVTPVYPGWWRLIVSEKLNYLNLTPLFEEKTGSLQQQETEKNRKFLGGLSFSLVNENNGDDGESLYLDAFNDHSDEIQYFTCGCEPSLLDPVFIEGPEGIPHICGAVPPCGGGCGAVGVLWTGICWVACLFGKFGAWYWEFTCVGGPIGAEGGWYWGVCVFDPCDGYGVLPTLVWCVTT